MFYNDHLQDECDAEWRVRSPPSPHTDVTCSKYFDDDDADAVDDGDDRCCDIFSWQKQVCQKKSISCFAVKFAHFVSLLPGSTTCIKRSTWSSWMAHCLPPTGLCQRQKNHGDDEEQESVRGEPSLVIVPNLGNLDTISIPLAPSSLIRRRRSRMRRELNIDMARYQRQHSSIVLLNVLFKPIWS